MGEIFSAELVCLLSLGWFHSRVPGTHYLVYLALAHIITYSVKVKQLSMAKDCSMDKNVSSCHL